MIDESSDILPTARRFYPRHSRNQRFNLWESVSKNCVNSFPKNLVSRKRYRGSGWFAVVRGGTQSQAPIESVPEKPVIKGWPQMKPGKPNSTTDGDRCTQMRKSSQGNPLAAFGGRDFFAESVFICVHLWFPSLRSSSSAGFSLIARQNLTEKNGSKW